MRQTVGSPRIGFGGGLGAACRLLTGNGRRLSPAESAGGPGGYRPPLATPLAEGCAWLGAPLPRMEPVV